MKVKLGSCFVQSHIHLGCHLCVWVQAHVCGVSLRWATRYVEAIVIFGSCISSPKIQSLVRVATATIVGPGHGCEGLVEAPGSGGQTSGGGTRFS